MQGGGPIASYGLCGHAFVRISAYMPREDFDSALTERQQHAATHRPQVAVEEYWEQLDRLRLFWTARWLADNYPNASAQ
jgi:hypothetical protein